MENHSDSDLSTGAAGPDARLDALWQALRLVIDPELGVDIVTLGLVYDAVIEDGVARITHTLTTPGCPMEEIISRGIRDSLSFVEGIREVDLNLVWDPAWHPGMIARTAAP